MLPVFMSLVKTVVKVSHWPMIVCVISHMRLYWSTQNFHLYDAMLLSYISLLWRKIASPYDVNHVIKYGNRSPKKCESYFLEVWN